MSFPDESDETLKIRIKRKNKKLKPKNNYIKKKN